MSAPSPGAWPSARDVVIGLLASRPQSVPRGWLDADARRERLVAICRAHAVHLAVADCLRREPDGNQPCVARVIDTLEADKVLRGACLLGADARLAAIHQALAERDIPCCLLKGLALVHTIYKANPLSRCFGDIDILVPEQHLDATLDVFQGQGYRVAEHKRDIQALRHYNHKICFLAEGAVPNTVDVHFRPIGKKLYEQTARLPTDAFFAGPHTVDIRGARIRVPAPELHVLYLCVHLSLQHHLAALNWLYDLRIFAQREPSLDWDDVVARARDYRTCRAVAASLIAARSILDAPVPPDAIARLLPSDPGPVTRVWMHSRMHVDNVISRKHDYRQRTLAGKFARMSSEVLLIDRAADRWRSVRRWVLPEPFLLRATYRVQGRVPLFLCYVVHPFVLLAMGFSLVRLTLGYWIEACKRGQGPVFRGSTHGTG